MPAGVYPALSGTGMTVVRGYDKKTEEKRKIEILVEI
jgi:hypothetical protein